MPQTARPSDWSTTTTDALAEARTQLRRLEVAIAVRRYAGMHNLVALVDAKLDLPPDVVHADIMIGALVLEARRKG